jgi:hypothetical protein
MSSFIGSPISPILVGLSLYTYEYSFMKKKSKTYLAFQKTKREEQVVFERCTIPHTQLHSHPNILPTLRLHHLTYTYTKDNDHFPPMVRRELSPFFLFHLKDAFPLKGQCHEIFDFRFSTLISFPKAWRR